MAALTTTPAGRTAQRHLSFRAKAAVEAGRAAAMASRHLRLGAGTTIGGRVTGTLAPGALEELAAGRQVVLVTGTNGKSTTTALTVAALGGACTNASGANVPPGLVAALAADDRALAVLEVDELHLPDMVRQVHPYAVVLLNLSRDQQHRSHEVARIARRWRTALDGTTARVVANATDPNIVYAAGSSATWVQPDTLWRSDAQVCPACGRLLAWTSARWSCVCGAAQPAAHVTVVGDEAILDGTAQVPVPLALPGPVNLDNAAFALAVADLLQVPAPVAAARMRAVSEVSGRYATLEVGGRSVRLLLAKNPAGWAAALPMVPDEGLLVLGVNARGEDSRDTSWLWDVDLASVRGREVGVFGEAAADLELRLRYEGIPTRSADTLGHLLPLLPPAPVVTAVANYSAFRGLLRVG
jgi:UDP-N-acetylmuramyl tripeptide synthase